MVKLLKTDSENPDFENLVVLLDAVLRDYDGEDHAFYAQFNKTNLMNEIIVAYVNEKPVGCGAIKKYDGDTAEVKRMYVLPEFRGQGIARQVLDALESWASEIGFTQCILETGFKQVDAIHLYHKSGYCDIENYGQYAGVDNSICMKKQLL